VLAALLALAVPLSADPSVEDIRAKHDLPALARARLLDGTLTIEVAGVRKAGEAARAAKGDQWHLGSDTKAMTATLVALFVERKKLRWDQPVAEILTDVDFDPKLARVTLEMLLAHRSGLSGDLLAYGGGKLWAKLWEPGLDVEEGRMLLAREMLGAPPASEPGSRFEYSNANYIISGAVLERLSGLPWERLIEKELFRPLGMRCGFGAAGEEGLDPPDQPWGHVREGSAWKPLFKDNPPPLGPAGTVHCDLASWGKFLQLQLDGGAGRPTKLLKPDSFKKLQSSYPGQEYTYGGWGRVSRKWAGASQVALTHAGSNTMNYCVAWLAPERNLAVFAAANAAGPEAERAVDEAVGGLLP
jgi:CubicO group peptidase (beta-lactamase class C family)